MQILVAFYLCYYGDIHFIRTLPWYKITMRPNKRGILATKTTHGCLHDHALFVKQLQNIRCGTPLLVPVTDGLQQTS